MHFEEDRFESSVPVVRRGMEILESVEKRRRPVQEVLSRCTCCDSCWCKQKITTGELRIYSTRNVQVPSITVDEDGVSDGECGYGNNPGDPTRGAIVEEWLSKKDCDSSVEPWCYAKDVRWIRVDVPLFVKDN